ncbi:MAG: type 1 glutamine amidotransferase [Phycisphaerales bacterium]|nr:MAG: type 1 glutamine amidotransferase [Phycisphaerales bacterium]
MRFHWLQNIAFEDAANVGVWAAERGHEVTATRLYAGQALPHLDEIDALAIMGGPMNVYQYRDYPWLIEEKRFIERAVRLGVPTVGVCLGAQLIADVLGAKVTQNREIEIGWFDITLTPDAADVPLAQALPERFLAFSWHGDTFEIPTGATHLAQSEACANQAFVYARNVLALQFHLDYSAESIGRMLAHCDNELVEGPFIQNQTQITANLAQTEETCRRLFALLDGFFDPEPAR